MKIAIGNDHSGVQLKRELVEYMEGMGHTVVNCGTDTTESIDYPVIAQRVAKNVVAGDCDRGVLICGTGIGISIAANKVKGVRCAHCSEAYSAMLSRAHNNANIVAIGARIIGPELAKAIVEAFLTNDFDGGRHQRRIDLVSRIEQGEDVTVG